jgi:pimeloyl-ACP methyl ester carboxylesterase
MCDERVWGQIPKQLREAGHPVQFADLSSQSTIHGMAADALAQAPEGRFVAAGFSMGAIAAFEMARIAPERLAGLVLIAFNASADLAERSAVRPAQQQRVRAGELAAVVAKELKPNYLARANEDDADILRLTMDMALALGPEVFVRQSEALRARPDLRPALSEIAVPTLLLCGGEDSLCPPEWHQKWAERIGASAQLEVIENAGHLLPLERPLQACEALLAWLSEIRAD